MSGRRAKRVAMFAQRYHMCSARSSQFVVSPFSPLRSCPFLLWIGDRPVRKYFFASSGQNSPSRMPPCGSGPYWGGGSRQRRRAGRKDCEQSLTFFCFVFGVGLASGGRCHWRAPNWAGTKRALGRERQAPLSRTLMPSGRRAAKSEASREGGCVSG